MLLFLIILRSWCLIELCPADGATIMPLEPCAQTGFVKCVSTRKFTSLITICTNLFEANVAVNFLVSFHWWQFFEKFFTDSARLRFLLSISVKDVHTWQTAVLHQTLQHLEWICRSYIHHMNMVCVVDVKRWANMSMTRIACESLYLWLIYTICVWNSNWLSISLRLVIHRLWHSWLILSW